MKEALNNYLKYIHPAQSGIDVVNWEIIHKWSDEGKTIAVTFRRDKITHKVFQQIDVINFLKFISK